MWKLEFDPFLGEHCLFWYKKVYFSRNIVPAHSDGTKGISIADEGNIFWMGF